MKVCLEAAADYLLDPAPARRIIGHVVDTIESEWDSAAHAARLTSLQRRQLWQRQMMNPFVTYGYND